mgnify:CR=1 FL=1
MAEETDLPTSATPSAAPEHSGEESEDEWLDETPATLFLRAVFTLLAGAFLSYTQYHAPIYGGENWNRWILLSALANFLLPLGIVWFFFGQGLRHLDWLKEQRLNAWNYGWQFRHWKRHALLALGVTAAMLPFLFWASRDAGTRAFYHAYFPPAPGALSWLWLIASLIIYMLCWEWFHRGFLLFGMAQGFGPIPAILLQAALFGAAHWGKPPLELGSSFVGGLLLGVLCWREKSFVPAFFMHALIHVIWAFLIFL